MNSSDGAGLASATTITLSDITTCPDHALHAGHHRADGTCLHHAPAPPPPPRTSLVVTVQGSPRRRYVVDEYDLFTGLGGVLRPESRPGAGDGDLDHQFGHPCAALTWFGARWLRRMGVVDEMYRTLSMSAVVKVERLPRVTVWGQSR